MEKKSSNKIDVSLLTTEQIKKIVASNTGKIIKCICVKNSEEVGDFIPAKSLEKLILSGYVIFIVDSRINIFEFGLSAAVVQNTYNL